MRGLQVGGFRVVPVFFFLERGGGIGPGSEALLSQKPRSFKGEGLRFRGLGV